MIVGLATDGAGNPIADARLQLVPDATPDLPALRAVRAPAVPVEGISGPRGVFRLAADRPGLLLATTPNGLGATVSRCWPGRAERLVLLPMAELVAADGAALHLWPALRDAAGERRRLPPMRGAALRLPAGRYELWWRLPDGHAWLELELRSGERRTLEVPSSRVLIQRPAGTAMHPEGFADLQLLGPDGTGALRGAAARSTRFERAPDTDAWCTADLGAGAAVRTVRLVAPAPEATAWILRGSPAGAFRLFAWAPFDADGTATVPTPDTPGDDWLVVTAPTHAAHATALALVDGPVELARGRVLECALRTPDGDPATAVAIAFAPGGTAPVTALAYTDSAGRARLGPIAAAGVVHVEDPRFLPARTAVAAADAAPLALRLRQGASVRGTARRADGTPAAGAAVILRDPRGRLGIRERAVAAGADGTFEFTGLEPGVEVLLFASVPHDGRTWSSLRPVPAITGAAAVVIELRDEDPTLQAPGSSR
ncbi:MAG: hypothetical protein AB7O97_17925 [Planctomycetota bacterium]